MTPEQLIRQSLEDPTAKLSNIVTPAVEDTRTVQATNGNVDLSRMTAGQLIEMGLRTGSEP